MKFNNRVRLATGCLLSLSLSNLPQVVVAETIQSRQMVSTTEVLEKFDRKAAEVKVATYLNQQNVEKRLIEQGVSAEEAKQRIASLNDAELQNLSHQIDKAQYGGDILVTVLLIVLIIYLVKRI